jgi:hypothetical protein
MKGSFFLSCPPDLGAGLYPFCMSFVGGSRTITANTVVNIVIPTEKTSVHVVDPAGKGIAGVKVQIWHSVGMDICTAAKAKIFSDFPTIANNSFSIAVTDANGFANMTTVKMTAACDANVELTPDGNSRYQSRSVVMTISDNSDSTIVLTIPSPVISLGAVTTAGSGLTAVRTLTVTGENFLGTTGVTWNGLAISVFKVVNNNKLTFVLPADAAGTGSLVVTNGGGSASYTLN